MAIEIERKFLVDVDLWSQYNKPEGVQLKQTYLLTDPDKTIRVRAYGEKGFITIKGKTKGISRAEFEYEIPLVDAKELIAKYGEIKIEKTRFRVEVGKYTWDLDVFEGDNEGLIIAEVELENESETFEKPLWLGKEVSDDIRYYNSNLQTNPFKNWR